MIRIKKDRSAVIPDTERHIGFENDHLIETRLFCIEDTALADFTFKLDIENTDVVSLTPVAASEAAVSGMLLEWPVTRDALGSGGLICAQLRAFDADGNRVWHSEKMEFTAGESVHTAANASDPATITEFEQIEKKVTQALASMDAVYDDVTGKYSEIVQMGEDYTAAMKAVDTLSEQAGAHYADKANPHGVTAGQVGAYTKTETDGKIAALTNKYELIETITLTEATNSIERSVEPDGTEYNFKKLFIYMKAALTDQSGYFGVHLWDGTTLAVKNLAFGSTITTTSRDYMMELSVEDGILHQTAPESADKDYLSTLTRTAAATFFGGAKMMDKISKIKLHHFNSLTFAVGTVIKIYGVRA